MTQTTVKPSLALGTLHTGRLPIPELIALVVGLGSFFAFPSNLGFMTEIVIMILLVLSLDLLLGYTGIASLGQAAMFGGGAYCAGLFALHVHSDPLLGLIMAALFGGLMAGLSGLLFLRAHGLSFIILTIAFGSLAFAVANQLNWLTGGDDGLYGYMMAPLFGAFEFDFFGRTGFLYSLGILLVVFYGLRRLVNSPFGLSAQGIREDRQRMTSLGFPVYRVMLMVYIIAGAIAGIAGALSAQTIQVVGLQSLSFTLSAEALVMLILGGTGRLYGAIIGTVVFMVVHHYAADLDPSTWMLVIGLMLIAVVLFLPKGMVQLVDMTRNKLSRLNGGASHDDAK